MNATMRLERENAGAADALHDLVQCLCLPSGAAPLSIKIFRIAGKAWPGARGARQSIAHVDSSSKASTFKMS